MGANLRGVVGMVGAGFFGAALTMALGSDNPKTPAVPRYSLQVMGNGWFITDNETNKLHIYRSDADASRLLGSADLNQTGKPEIVGIKAGPDK